MSANTPEGKVKKLIKSALSGVAGCWYFMPVAGMLGRAGIPDFIGCYKGRFFAIEAKAPGNKPTDLQRHVMQLISDAGGVVGVVDSLESMDSFLERLL